MTAIRRWENGRAQVDDMLAKRFLERVPADRDHAEFLIGQANRHVASAGLVRDTDPGTAFSAAYDAARKALTAVLAVQGLRPTSTGGHVVVRDAALAQLDPPLGPLIKRFDWMRRTRNDHEYPSLSSPAAADEDVDDGVKIARELIEKATRMVEILPPYGH